MSTDESFMGRRIAPPSAHAKGQVKRGERSQQWYGRTAEHLFCRQTLSLQYVWRGYWYAARFPIPYERTGARWNDRTTWYAKSASRRNMRDAKGVPRRTSGAPKARFAGGGGSARMNSLVLRYFKRETEAQIQF